MPSGGSQRTEKKYNPLIGLEPELVPPMMIISVEIRDARVHSIGVRMHANLPSFPILMEFYLADENEKVEWEKDTINPPNTVQRWMFEKKGRRDRYKREGKREGGEEEGIRRQRQQTE